MHRVKGRAGQWSSRSDLRLNRLSWLRFSLKIFWTLPDASISVLPPSSSLPPSQCAVRAATQGRVLVLEGLEKAERNVLPVLNNLLENREMQLEDGRFLMSAERYDKLLQVQTSMLKPDVITLTCLFLFNSPQLRLVRGLWSCIFTHAQWISHSSHRAIPVVEWENCPCLKYLITVRVWTCYSTYLPLTVFVPSCFAGSHQRGAGQLEDRPSERGLPGYRSWSSCSQVQGQPSGSSSPLSLPGQRHLLPAVQGQCRNLQVI